MCVLQFIQTAEHCAEKTISLIAKATTRNGLSALTGTHAEEGRTADDCAITRTAQWKSSVVIRCLYGCCYRRGVGRNRRQIIR